MLKSTYRNTHPHKAIFTNITMECPNKFNIHMMSVTLDSDVSVLASFTHHGRGRGQAAVTRRPRRAAGGAATARTLRALRVTHDTKQVTGLMCTRTTTFWVRATKTPLPNTMKPRW